MARAIRPTPGVARQIPPGFASALLATLAVCVAGIHGVTMSMDLDAQWLGPVAEVLVAVGLGLCWLRVRAGLPDGVVEIPLTAFYALLAGRSLLTGVAIDPFVPGEVVGDHQKEVAVFLLWMVVYGSFVASNHSRMLFLCVPVLALLGIASTMYIDPPLIAVFLVFAAAAVYLAVHGISVASGGYRRDEVGQTRTQWMAVAACVTAASVLGFVLSAPLRMLGGALLLAAPVGVASRNDSLSPFANAVRLAESDYYRVSSGPVKLSDRVVMRVTGARQPYWRGTSYDAYVGTGWRSTLPEYPASTSVTSDTSDSDGWGGTDRGVRVAVTVDRATINETGAAAQSMSHQVQLEPGGLFTSLYSPTEARSVVLDGRGMYLARSAGVSTDAAGKLSVRRPLTGVTYEVRSDEPPVDSASLGAATGDSPPEITERYTGLAGMDSTARDRVEALGSQATRGLVTRYDRVVALKRLVSSRCRYNTDVQPAPDGVDVADAFLNNTREGYCDVFATSLAVLCRTQGIPARVVSGFLVDEVDATGQTFVVRERNKHMWTEVHFAGVGWLPFDATEDAQDVTKHDRSSEDQQAGTLLSRLLGRGALPLLALVLCIALIVYAVTNEVRRPRLGRSALPGLGPVAAAILAEYASACRQLARYAPARAVSETPHEYLARLATEPSVPAAALRPMGALTESACGCLFGGTEEDGARLAAARTERKALRAILRDTRPPRAHRGKRVTG